MKRYGQLFFGLLCVVVSAAGLYNVLSDNIEVERAAKALACGGKDDKGCNAQTTRIERNPIAQSFEIVTSKKKVDVRCMRAYVFAGDYACELR